MVWFLENNAKDEFGGRLRAPWLALYSLEIRAPGTRDPLGSAGGGTFRSAPKSV